MKEARRDDDPTDGKTASRWAERVFGKAQVGGSIPPAALIGCSGPNETLRRSGGSTQYAIAGTFRTNSSFVNC